MLSCGPYDLKAREGVALCRLWPFNLVAAGEFNDVVREKKRNVVVVNMASQGPRGLVGFHAFDADRMEFLVDDGESVPSRKVSKPEWSEHPARPSRALA